MWLSGLRCQSGELRPWSWHWVRIPLRSISFTFQSCSPQGFELEWPISIYCGRIVSIYSIRRSKGLKTMTSLISEVRHSCRVPRDSILGLQNLIFIYIFYSGLCSILLTWPLPLGTLVYSARSWWVVIVL